MNQSITIEMPVIHFKATGPPSSARPNGFKNRRSTSKLMQIAAHIVYVATLTDSDPDFTTNCEP